MTTLGILLVFLAWACVLSLVLRDFVRSKDRMLTRSSTVEHSALNRGVESSILSGSTTSGE